MSNVYRVAEMAGVSVATVSRVLNNSTSVSRKTRLKVEEAMKALNYGSNKLRRISSPARTNLVGFIVPDLNNPFYLEQAKGINDYLKPLGINLVFVESEETEEELMSTVRRLLSNRVDGMIICAPNPQQIQSVDAVIEPALLGGASVVMNGMIESKFEIDKISTDSSRGAYMATEHLLKLGHTRIAMISGADENRFGGYYKALIDYNITPDKSLVVYGDFRQHSGYEAMKRLLRLPNRPSAVFSMNDIMAIGAMLALEEEHISIPDEMSVVGFDDIIWATIIRPRLTSVAQPKYEMGRTLADMLYSRISGAYAGPGRFHLFSPRLAIRQSTVSFSIIV